MVLSVHLKLLKGKEGRKERWKEGREEGMKERWKEGKMEGRKVGGREEGRREGRKEGRPSFLFSSLLLSFLPSFRPSLPPSLLLSFLPPFLPPDFYFDYTPDNKSPNRLYFIMMCCFFLVVSGHLAGRFVSSKCLTPVTACLCLLSTVHLSISNVKPP